ncbi:microcin C transport system permease protein [Desulfobaculum xiamenense]|uniref:Microcin C transport system permease protein n=1 Tax=Desulfobaculum xiamenense TaxID=995050 RepID=A0A846QN63_9BACT|nr:ABC transporter permease [Desulfobaculum xiamenense]NJB66674.1 microcin C transport system permease protein [Desulfobaculum xiamenense]
MPRLSPLCRRRLANFRANRRGFWSLVVFVVLFAVSLGAEFVANDRPFVVSYRGELHMPVFVDYSERQFGGDFDVPADYRDPYIIENIEAQGWMLWPPIRFADDTIDFDLPGPAPQPPSARHWLGTDDQGRDLVARLLYGFRVSVLFGLLLTLFSTVIGVCAGAVQGYHGGRVDMIGQRFMEIWSGMPVLYLLIILADMIRPGFWWLLGIMLLFSWMSLVGVVRAEFLRGRNLDYVRAARAMGVSDSIIMFRHILPNAMVAGLTFLPFVLNGAIGTLTSLDFLGFGMPPGSPSLGELLSQGKANLHAPWIGLSAFVVLSTLLTLLVFIGEAARDALDPNRSADL